jgi:hypothetical protein
LVPVVSYTYHCGLREEAFQTIKSLPIEETPLAHCLFHLN